jgi:hypothetical protein
LLPIIAGAEGADRAVLLECFDVRTGPRSRGNMYALRTPTHKLIRILGHEKNDWSKQALYHVRKDPAEQRAIAVAPGNSLHQEIANQFDSILAQVVKYELPFAVTKFGMPLRDRRRFVDRRRLSGDVIRKELTTRQAKRLQSLGYVK